MKNFYKKEISKKNPTRKFNNLSKKFRKIYSDFTAVGGISFEMQRGEVFLANFNGTEKITTRKAWRNCMPGSIDH